MAAINLGRATAIIPQLKELVSLIQIKRPLYEFHATGYRERYDDDTDTTTVWVSEFEVVQDADRVGEIAYERKVGRKNSAGDKPDAFVVRSENIAKKRGSNRTSMITTNIDSALKEVIKVFASPTQDSICSSLVRSVANAFDNTEYSWRRVLQDIAGYSGADVYRWIIESHIKGTVQPMPASFVVHENKLHLYDTYLAGNELVATSNYKSGANRKGTVVKILSDDTIRVVPFSYDVRKSYENNGDVLMRYRNFEEMPIKMQERIAVLKIAEENEPISDVGVKFADDLMYIVE